MIVEHGGLARLSGPTSRSGGTKELGASGENVMVHSEALLVGLFPDENIESLSEVVIEPMNGQSCVARRRNNILEDTLSSLCRRLVDTGRWRVAFHLVGWLRVVCGSVGAQWAEA